MAGPCSLETIEKAQQIATDRLRSCDNERPDMDMGIGGMTPARDT